MVRINANKIGSEVQSKTVIVCKKLFNLLAGIDYGLKTISTESPAAAVILTGTC